MSNHHRLQRQLMTDVLNGIENLVDGLETELQLRPLVRVLYSLRDRCVDWEDAVLFDELMARMLDLLYVLVSRVERSSETVNTFLLYLKEITFSPGFVENLRGSKSTEELLVFQNRLLEKGLNSAARAVYYIVSYSRQREHVSTYLGSNLEHLVKFYESYYHREKNKGRKESFEQRQSRQLIYVSIFLFRRFYYFDLIPSRWVDIHGLRLVASLPGDERFTIEPRSRTLDSAFYDVMFPREAPFEAFEGPDLVTAATGIGSVYNFGTYWILLSLWRRARNQTYVPSHYSKDKRWAMEQTLEAAEVIDNSKISAILGISKSDIPEAVQSYREYLLGGMRNT